MKTMQQLLLGIYLPKVPQGQTIAEHLNILKLFWGFATRFKKTPVSSLPCTIPATSVHGQFQLWTFCIQWTPLGAPIISIGPDQLGAGATTDAASHASLDALFRFLSGCQVKKFTCHRNSWRFKFVQLLYQIVPSFQFCTGQTANSVTCFISVWFSWFTSTLTQGNLQHRSTSTRLCHHRNEALQIAPAQAKRSCIYEE